LNAVTGKFHPALAVLPRRIIAALGGAFIRITPVPLEEKL
jgi:hypothetical protein